MDSRRIAELIELVREFQDRSARWLFERPDNMRELLSLLAADLASQLDFSQMRSASIAMILRDFRERRGDLLLEIPYLTRQEEHETPPLPKSVWIYLLFEHQTTPDPEMGLRLLLLKAELWRRQRQQWIEQGQAIGALRLSPVVPIVFYTGERPWQEPIAVSTLMDLPAGLARFQRESDVLMLNLREAAPDELEAADSPVSWILRVWQEAKAEADCYVATLERVLTHLAGLLSASPDRLADLLYFLLAFTMRFREAPDRERALDAFESAAPDPEVGKETVTMGKTIYEALIDEGVEKGIQRGIEQGIERGIEQGIERGMEQGVLVSGRQAVVRVLRHRFQAVPQAVVEQIESIDDQKKLDALLDRALDVASPERLLAD